MTFLRRRLSPAEKGRIAVAANRLLATAHGKFSLALGPPIPVDLIAELVLGLRIDRLDRSRTSGKLLCNEKLIVINASEAEHRQRFTLAHEIGHFVLHTSDAAAQQRARQAGERKRELEANTFAAHLLMPARLFEPEMIRLNGVETREQWALSLARRFAVSSSAARVRLQEILDDKAGNVGKLSEIRGHSKGGRSMDFMSVLMEVGDYGNISALANEGRAALKQVSTHLRNPNDVRELALGGLKACKLLERSVAAEKTRQVGGKAPLSELKAYDAYEPLRSHEDPERIEEGIQRARKVLEVLASGRRPAPILSRQAIEFFTRVIQLYQEATARALTMADLGMDAVEIRPS